ncbi:MAG TPA: hypothetical protein VEI97_11555, partial [bacterium]|nr:hypothetical protein [bacterium]
TAEPGRVQYRRLDCEGAWAEVEFLTPEGTLAAFPSVAVGATAQSLGFAYQQYTAGNYEVFYRGGTFTP